MRTARYGGKEQDDVTQFQLNEYLADTEIAEGEARAKLAVLMTAALRATLQSPAAKQAAEQRLETYRATLKRQGFNHNALQRMESMVIGGDKNYKKAMREALAS
jgi:hypothetical protein